MNLLGPITYLPAIPGAWHEFAELFPMLDPTVAKALAADVLEHGIREPIVQFEGKVLDGRNRYMAARDCGIARIPVVQFEGSRAEALAYVLSTNLHRRHLTESQRAAIAAKLANMRQGARTDLQPSANLPEVSQAQAADMLDVSERSVRSARAVLDHGTPELAAAVETGEVSVSAAAAVAELPPEEQAATLAEGPKAVKAKAKEIREAKAHKPRVEPEPAPEPDEEPEAEPVDPVIAKQRRELAKLTTAALIDEVIGLRADLTDEKAKTRALKAEVASLKERLADFTGDDAETIRRLQKTVGHKNSEMFRVNANFEVVQKQNYALKKRVEELEAMGIRLNP